MTAFTKQIPGTKGYWYWWRDPKHDGTANDVTPLPAFIGLGPFGNNVFMPGKGWVCAEKIGGEWLQEPIPFPIEHGNE